jgi:hypothetical protein
MPYYLLTEAEIALLQKVIDRELGRPINAPQRPVPVFDSPPAPDTYIAWPPSGGIPALTLTGDAGPDGGADLPGSATCDIYKIDTSDTPELVAISGLDKTVYNLSEMKVPQRWILVTRTKGGQWIVTWAPHQARWIKFVVNDASGFATTDSSVAVDGVTYVDGFTPGTAITTVYNEPASSNYIFEGDDNDVGQAEYDPGNDKYWIRMMECP